MGKTGVVTDPSTRASTGPTQRCPVCKKLNRVPLHSNTGKARCGACKAPLTPLAGTSPPRAGDLGRQVIERWDAMLRLVPGGMALGRAVGRSGADDPAADPVGWLANAAHVPRGELDQIRLLRIHLASNKAVDQGPLTRALDTLDRAKTGLGPLLPGDTPPAPPGGQMGWPPPGWPT